MPITKLAISPSYHPFALSPCMHYPPRHNTPIYYEVILSHLTREHVCTCRFENGDKCTIFNWDISDTSFLNTILHSSTNVHRLAASSRGYRPALLAHNQITNILPRPCRRAAAETILALLFNTNVGHYIVAQHLSMRCSDDTRIYV